jgi:urease accessory protein
VAAWDTNSSAATGAALGAGHQAPAGLAEGMAQIALDPEHLSVVLALALLGALAGPQAAWRIQLALPIGIAVGALAWAAVPPLAWLPAAGLGASALAALLAALAPRLPAALYPILAALGGALHGLWAAQVQHGSLTTPSFAAGAAAAAAVVHALTAWPALELRTPWQRIALRVAASWIAAIALLALGAAARQA